MGTFALALVLLLSSCTHHSNIKAPPAPEAVQSPALSLAEKGKALVAMKGCVACHSADGTRMTGPSYKGIYGTDVKLADRTTVRVDENYIRESIEYPLAKIVEGYPPSMPAYKGLVSDEEIGAITEYIKSLK